MRVAYFAEYPEETRLEWLPDDMPPFKILAPRILIPRFIPFYKNLVTKYGLDRVIEVTNQPLDKANWTLYEDKKAKKMLQTVRISHHDLEKQSLNILFYILSQDSDLDDWLVDLIFGKEPTIWVFSLLGPKN